jgi:hypothetical protein
MRFDISSSKNEVNSLPSLGVSVFSYCNRNLIIFVAYYNGSFCVFKFSFQKILLPIVFINLTIAYRYIFVDK